MTLVTRSTSTEMPLQGGWWHPRLSSGIWNGHSKKSCEMLMSPSCKIVPRDEGRRAKIIESWDEAMASLDSDLDFTDEYFEKEFQQRKRT